MSVAANKLAEKPTKEMLLEYRFALKIFIKTLLCSGLPLHHTL